MKNEGRNRALLSVSGAIALVAILGMILLFPLFPLWILLAITAAALLLMMKGSERECRNCGASVP